MSIITMLNIGVLGIFVLIFIGEFESIETAIENIGILDWSDRSVEIYSVAGQNMSALRGNLPQGIYILRSGEHTQKMIVR